MTDQPIACVPLKSLNIIRTPYKKASEVFSSSYFLGISMVLLTKGKYVPDSVCTMGFKVPLKRRWHQPVVSCASWMEKQIISLESWWRQKLWIPERGKTFALQFYLHKGYRQVSSTNECWTSIFELYIVNNERPLKFLVYYINRNIGHGDFFFSCTFVNHNEGKCCKIQ